MLIAIAYTCKTLTISTQQNQNKSQEKKRRRRRKGKEKLAFDQNPSNKVQGSLSHVFNKLKSGTRLLPDPKTFRQGAREI